jgi:hypothetical protein
MKNIYLGLFAITAFPNVCDALNYHSIPDPFEQEMGLNQEHFETYLGSTNLYPVDSLHLVQFSDGWLLLLVRQNNITNPQYFPIGGGWEINEEPDPDACNAAGEIPGCAGSGGGWPPPWPPYIYSQRDACYADSWGQAMGAVIDVQWWVTPDDTDFYEVHYLESGSQYYWYDSNGPLQNLEVSGPHMWWEYDSFVPWDLAVKACNENGCTWLSNPAEIMDQMWPCYSQY